jgi:hypothetical protein
MKKQILLFSFSIFGFNALAQTTEEAAAKAPILKLFEGMSKSDSAMVHTTLMSNARLETITKNKNGETTVKTDSFEGFLKSIGSQPAGNLDERLSSIELRIDGDLATAWTPYKFYFKGTFSHCGVNAFQLVKTASGWKIWSIIDTRRKENCL